MFISARLPYDYAFVYHILILTSIVLVIKCRDWLIYYATNHKITNNIYIATYIQLASDRLHNDNDTPRIVLLEWQENRKIEGSITIHSLL